jgi:type II secretory pathway pseudopilin PulG
MVFKSGFLLTELMISIVIFTIFLAAICSFQALSIKNKDLALKRMEALNLAISQARDIGQRDQNQEHAISTNFFVSIEDLPEILVENKLFGLKKDKRVKTLKLKRVIVKAPALEHKTCKVCLIAS